MTGVVFRISCSYHEANLYNYLRENWLDKVLALIAMMSVLLSTGSIMAGSKEIVDSAIQNNKLYYFRGKHGQVIYALERHVKSPVNQRLFIN